MTRTTNHFDCILRGFRRRCPSCGKGALFRGFLKPVETCADCRTAFGHIAADDFPPYLTILVVGHVIVPLVVLLGRAEVPNEIQAAICLPLTLGLSLLLLPRLKGAVLGLMWSLGVTGRESSR
jgi:uncharacterized protein (DUF983 family)